MNTNDNKTSTKGAEIAEKVSQEIAPKEPVTPETAPFELMDAADDEQILAEVKGKGATVIEEWVYSFEQDGKEITGLSWTGTKNAAVWLARKGWGKLNIKTVDYKQDPTDPEYMLFNAIAEDTQNGLSMPGFKRQWTKLKTRKGDIITNPFWYEQGASKAMRNAMQALMPADWIASMIKDWMENGKVKKIEMKQASPAKPTSKYWAKFYGAKSADDCTKAIAEVRVAKDLTDGEKYMIVKKLQEKLDSLPVQQAVQAAPVDDSIPF
jgi:hypothetical protein